MRKLIKKAGEKLTRKNAIWFAKVNLQSWVFQGLAVGLLTVAGVSALAAVVSAKVAAWVIFAAQCVKAARG